ncbi:hypothetical protein KQH61_05760 [bacterium]|nr:hypothetical protein [bacterium]MCB2179409.1 hypothetical protein [bacterium]
MPKGMKDSRIEKRLQREVEGLYGNEAFTGDLDDTSAKELLKWAETRVRKIVLKTTEMDDEQAEVFMYPQLKALRRMARFINRALSSEAPNEDWVEKVLTQARVVYGDSYSEPDRLKLQTLLSNWANGTEVIQALKHSIEGEENGDEEEDIPQQF